MYPFRRVFQSTYINGNISVENNTFSVIPFKEKLTNKELVVIVHSRLDAFEARQSSRDTWASKGVYFYNIQYTSSLYIYVYIYTCNYTSVRVCTFPVGKFACMGSKESYDLFFI